MAEHENKLDDCEQQLDAIIAQYYGSAEKGEAPDPGHFIARYPDFKEELSEFFAHLGMLQHSGRSTDEVPRVKPKVIDEPKVIVKRKIIDEPKPIDKPKAINKPKVINNTSPRTNVTAEARPVGLSDRAYRWARRNPWVAATSALVGLIGIAGPLFPVRQATPRLETDDHALHAYHADFASLEAERASQAARSAELRKREAEQLIVPERTDPALALERLRGDDTRKQWEAASNHVKNKQFSEARLILQSLIDEAKQRTRDPRMVIAHVPYPITTASLYRQLAALETNAGRPEASRVALLELASLFESGTQRDDHKDLRWLADLWLDLGRPDDAVIAYEPSTSIADKSAMIPELGQFSDYLPADDFRTLTQKMRSRNLKPAAIEGKRIDESSMYRARFERSEGFYSYYWGMNDADFQKRSEEMQPKGLVLVQHFTFLEAANPVHCAIWEIPRPLVTKSRIEGESLHRIAWTSGHVSEQNMTEFKASTWSGDKQLLWINGAQNDELKVGFQMETAGRFDVSAIFTTAFDYGIVDLYLDDQIVSEGLDLFRPGDVTTVNTLEHSLGTHLLKAGKHQIRIIMKGCHRDAVNRYGFGLDYISFKQAGEAEAKENKDVKATP